MSPMAAMMALLTTIALLAWGLAAWVLCFASPAAANQTFLVSDGEDLSTAGLPHP